jgi:hypothetical protein
LENRPTLPAESFLPIWRRGGSPFRPHSRSEIARTNNRGRGECPGLLLCLPCLWHFRNCRIPKGSVLCPCIGTDGHGSVEDALHRFCLPRREKRTISMHLAGGGVVTWTQPAWGRSQLRVGDLVEAGLTKFSDSALFKVKDEVSGCTRLFPFTYRLRVFVQSGRLIESRLAFGLTGASLENAPPNLKLQGMQKVYENRCHHPA